VVEEKIQALQISEDNVTVPEAVEEKKERDDSDIHNFAPPEITDEYSVHHILGRGAYSKVYLIQHKTTNKQQALKVIDKKNVSNPVRLASEVELLQRATHPNIINLVKTVDTPAHLFLITEYANGGELFDKIVDEGNLPELQVCTMFKKMVEAIKYLHGRGIVHRDIKPENVLILKGPDDSIDIKLSDFGIAKLFEQHTEPGKPARKNRMQTYSYVGSATYMAPEILLGEGYDYAVDMWSLGVLLYIMVSGNHPFDQTDSVEQVVAITSGKFVFGNGWQTISNSCKNLITRLLKPNPYDRLSASETLKHSWLMQLTTNVKAL